MIMYQEKAMQIAGVEGDVNHQEDDNVNNVHGHR